VKTLRIAAYVAGPFTFIWAMFVVIGNAGACRDVEAHCKSAWVILFEGIAVIFVAAVTLAGIINLLARAIRRRKT
jgi:hypothetical protein